MGKLDEIKQRLLSGSTTRQLINEGYAKSSVFYVDKKLRMSQSENPTSSVPVSDEIQELRHQKEIMKLRKEIAELEAAKDRIPERMVALEKSLDKLQSLLYDAVDTAIFECLKYAGVDEGWARNYADGWIERNIKE